MMRASVLVLPLIVLAAAPAASAQPIVQAEAQRVESPRNWIFELKVGFYHPDIDNEPGVAPTFDNVFGSGKKLLTQATLERMVFQSFGTISLGVGIGYAEFYGHSSFVDNPSETSSDVTSFHELPMWLQASYRFDWASKHLHIPFVPYGTLGSGVFYWWSNGHSGTKTGYMAAAGLQLLLNPFDPNLARDFDEDAGVNESYLFVEYAGWNVNGRLFPTGSKAKGFDLSDKVVSFGLALVF